MNFNNMYNPAFGAMNNPMQPMQQQPVEMNNLLSNEEIAQLRQKQGTQGGVFFRAPTELETKRANCTHKYNGQITLQPMGDGKYRCSICGEEFKLLDKGDAPAVDIVCEKANDVFQSIKTYYGPTSPELRSVYPVINVIKQLPQMFRTACEYADRVVPQNNTEYYGNNLYSPSNTYMNLTAGAPIPGMESNYGGNYAGNFGFNPQFNPAYPQNQQQVAPVQYPQPGINQMPAYGYPQQTQPQGPQGINYVQQVQAPQTQQQFTQPVYTQQAPGFNPQQQAQQNVPQGPTATPTYSAAANPIGSPMPAQPQTAPAPVAGPTNTANVKVGTQPVKFEA